MEATIKSLTVSNQSGSTAGIIYHYKYETDSSEPSYLYSYITDSNTLPRNTLVKEQTLQGSTVIKTVEYDYDAPANWDSNLNSNPTLNLGRIITTALADTDEDGDISDETTAATYYKCFEYNQNNLIIKEYPQSLDPQCDDVQPVTYSYNQNKQLASITKVADGTTLITGYTAYDNFGNPQTVTDPNGVSTTYTYDHLGRTLSQTISGKTTSYQYLGQDLKKVTYPAGDYMLYHYNSVLYGLTVHKLAKVEHKSASGDLLESVQYSYTVENNTLKTIEETKDENGTATRVKTTIEGYELFDGNTVRFIQITEGSPSDNSEVSVKTYYDADNQIIAKLEDPAGSALATRYFYDQQGQLIAVENAKGDTTTYQYDFNGNLVGTTVDPGDLNIKTKYYYDGFGRLIKTVSPDANATVYVYNPDGTLARKKQGCGGQGDNCKIIADYEYDSIGRLIRTNYNKPGNWMEEFYVYDGNTNFYPWSGNTVENFVAPLRGGTYGMGRLTASLVRFSVLGGNTTGFAVTAYSYTPQGQVKTKHYQLLYRINGDNQYDEEGYNPFSYWYSDNGIIQKMKYPTGRYVYYCIDSQNPNKITAVKTNTQDMTQCADGYTIAQNISYYPFGDIKQISLGNGQLQTFSRNKRYALINLKDGTQADDDLYHNISYDYDQFGNITSINETNSNPGFYPDHSLSYDNLHQLAGATISIGNTTYSISYQYDAAGRRTSRTENQNTENYIYDPGANRLTGVLPEDGNSVLLIRNNMGTLVYMVEYLDDMTIYAGATYTPQGFIYGKADWSQAGDTVQVGDTVIYFFHSNGEMAARYVASTNLTWNYGYDLAGNLIFQGEGAGNSPNEPVIEHIWLGNRLLASITGSGEACFIATAAFGSPLARQLDTFRAFRDQVLLRFALGRAFVEWYYRKGPKAAAWLKSREWARTPVRAALYVAAWLIRGWLAHPWLLLALSSLLLAAAAWLFCRWLGARESVALLVAVSLVFSYGIAYYLLMEPRPAQARSYSEFDIYYYTVDHIGRPFNLRDEGRSLRWYERHYPFGEVIEEGALGGAMTAGSGDMAVSWKPGFRFPGQFEEEDMGIAATGRSLFVQNHYREYLPRFGQYNRVDPLLYARFIEPLSAYNYAEANPYRFSDFWGLQTYPVGPPDVFTPIDRSDATCCKYEYIESPASCFKRCVLDQPFSTWLIAGVGGGISCIIPDTAPVLGPPIVIGTFLIPSALCFHLCYNPCNQMCVKFPPCEDCDK